MQQVWENEWPVIKEPTLPLTGLFCTLIDHLHYDIKAQRLLVVVVKFAGKHPTFRTLVELLRLRSCACLYIYFFSYLSKI